MGFVTRFLNKASQEIKVKLNESRLLKFYKVKQLKENSTENSALKKTRNSENSEKFLQNKKRKEKYSNSKNFVSRTLS